MRKFLKFLPLVLLLVSSLAIAATISQTPLVPAPLQPTDKFPLGRANTGIAYTGSVQQIMAYVQQHYSSAKPTQGPQGEVGPMGVVVSASAPNPPVDGQGWIDTSTPISAVAISGLASDLIRDISFAVWGEVTGDITTQTDLQTRYLAQQAKFQNLSTQLSALKAAVVAHGITVP